MDWQGNNVSTVAEFYSGKSIFVTGGTGFLGKVFIEKLLYSCRDINKIYILMREKRNESVEERARKMIDLPLFSRLKQNRPDALSKLVCVSGDMVIPDLGISEENVTKLINEVSVVFHLAATVKFNEPLHVALDINVDGTSRVLSLCKRMKKIKAFIHVSTAFSNCTRTVIEEVIYPPPAELVDVQKIVKMPNNDKAIDALISGWPNTYTFTKSLAENYVCDNHSLIPTAIIRPSIITAIKDGPAKGWVDNWYGMTGIVTATGKGYLRVMSGEKNNILDVIPVDYVANLMIVSAAKISSSTDVKVLHSCSSSVNPLTLEKVIDYTTTYSRINKFYDLPKPHLHLTKSLFILKLITFFTQILPAYIVDFFALLIGCKRKNVIIQNRIISGRDTVTYFTLRTWKISGDGAKTLSKTLSLEEQSEFPCDASHIDWSTYLPVYLDGIRRYLIKES